MARYYDKIGYETGEIVDDVYTTTVVEREYFGEVLRSTRNLVPGDKVNDDVSVSNRISIVADSNLPEDFTNIKYAMWHGKRWRVTSVEEDRPRLILELGGVYNGQGPSA